MAFRGIKDVIDAEINGQVRQYGWRKTPSQTTTAATWFDLSMSPGNPPPKYWFDAPPGIAKAVYQDVYKRQGLDISKLLVKNFYTFFQKSGFNRKKGFMFVPLLCQNPRMLDRLLGRYEKHPVSDSTPRR